MDPALASDELAPAPSVNRTLRIIELCLVLTVAFGPSLFTALDSFLSSVFDGTANAGKNYYLYRPRSLDDLVGGDVRYLASLAVCAYVFFRQGRSFRNIGLTWRKGDLLLGIPLALAHYLAYQAIYILFRDAGFGAVVPRGLGHYMYGIGANGSVGNHLFMSVVFAVHAVVIGLFEELIVRAYLMTEMVALTGNVSLAVFTSVALQTSYHLYQGWLSALCVGVGFLVSSLFYAATRRASPLVVSHALIDLSSALRQTLG